MMEDFNETLTYSLNDSILSSSAVASSSSTSSSNTLDQVTQNQQQQRNDGQNQQQQRPEPGSSVSYRVNISISDSASSDIRDDAWSCVVVVITFWLFASLTLILGLYGSFNLFLSPNYSQLLQVNSIFVQEIRVQPSTIPNEGPVLDGFYRPPSLDVEKIWSEVHTELLPTDFHKEWFYYLNEGSQIDISYVTKSHEAPLILVISQGKQQLVEWIEDPSYPNTTLSWNIILGNGSIKLETLKSSDYFVAVGNLNPDPVEVELTFTIRALLYNTTAAYYKCSLNYSVCHFKLTPFGSSAAVLSSPTQNKEGQRNDFYVKISYKPRWTTYFIGSGGMTVLVLLVIKIIAKLQSLMGDETQYEARETSSERAPLILHKDDDASSWGSSYDSASHDDDDGDLEDVLGQSILESTRNVDGDNKNTSNPKRLCVICFDSPRDCFFLPCGHCAACFTCGTRIAEEAGTCPICRRRMKKVRKIFTV